MAVEKILKYFFVSTLITVYSTCILVMMFVSRVDEDIGHVPTFLTWWNRSIDVIALILHSLHMLNSWNHAFNPSSEFRLN